MTTRKPIKIVKTEIVKPNVINVTVTSSRDSRKHYTVQCVGNKPKKCSCQGWVNSGGEKTGYKRIRCRHIREVAAQL